VTTGEAELHSAFGIDISPLVPKQYAAYRPLIAEALLFFVQRLPPHRLAAILLEQHSLPPDAAMSERLAALLSHCPTLHKLGQVVARDRRLAPELRQHLQALESMEPKTAMSAMGDDINRELKELSASAIRLGPSALAEASVAVVVPFSHRRASSSDPSEGVLKILKPGIEECLGEELVVWTALSTFIDERCEYHRIPTLRYAETLETIRELLANEIRLDLEQQHLVEAGRFYADAEGVKVPALLPFCTPRITAMERIRGHKVTESKNMPRDARQKLASLVIEALIARPVWMPQEASLFHADPHAGNLFFTDDGQLAILDWSLVGYLGKQERIHTMQIVLGALTFDANRIAQAISAMARSTPNEQVLRQVVDRALGRLYREQRIPGFRWLLNLLDDAMLSAGLRFGEDLLLFRKSVLTIEGVVADVSETDSLDWVLPITAIKQFSQELSGRAFALPTSRQFGTHLSNLDLLSLYWRVPSTATRFWKHVWGNWLQVKH
jgi:ubiquinone biosynthesis protein